MSGNFWLILLLLPLAFASYPFPSQNQSDENEPKSETCTIHSCARKVACVTIYQHRDEQGVRECLTFNNVECTNLKPWWLLGGSSRVSSVGSRKPCVRLYDQLDCKGESIEFDDHTDQTNLNKYNFDDRTKSVSSCHRKGESNKFEKCDANCSGMPACVTLHDRSTSFLRSDPGNHQCLTFERDECIPFDPFWSVGHFSLVMSADSHNTCVRLYDRKNCTGVSVDINGKVDDLKRLEIITSWHSASPCAREKSGSDAPVEITKDMNRAFARTLQNRHKNLEGANERDEEIMSDSDESDVAQNKACFPSGNRLIRFLFFSLIFLLK